ncbi:hypothetical protein HUJ05_004546 [Dendroctonus ponderosae]|nr:hypothetical protein HUJ05_004546 [Dendroctonus ponderosae]
MFFKLLVIFLATKQCVLQINNYSFLFFQNNRSSTMDDSRRFSCGSLVARRTSTVATTKQNDLPVENVYSQNKIATLQWQLREVEKSRELYKAVMKQVVTFLEKAHVSLEHLGTRLNRKNSVPRSKSEHYIVSEHHNTTQSQKALVEEHIASWAQNKKQEHHPDEIPPEKLSQEAFRLMRTAQSLLRTQEPNFAGSDQAEDPSDIEFLAQLAKEFPRSDEKPERSNSFSLTPKLVQPEHDLKISTAINRKLSLQLNGRRKNSPSELNRDYLGNTECHSLPPVIDRLECTIEANPLRNSGNEFLETNRKDKSPSSPATASISSMEDESGFSSMNSFQDIGVPLINSTAVGEVSARSILLKSMLHNQTDYTLIHNEFEHCRSWQESTMTTSLLHSEQRRHQKGPLKTSDRMSPCPEKKQHSLSDVKLWQKPATVQPDSASFSESGKAVEDLKSVASSASFQGNHKRWHSSPDKKTASSSLKVLWV